MTLTSSLLGLYLKFPASHYSWWVSSVVYILLPKVMGFFWPPVLCTLVFESLLPWNWHINLFCKGASIIALQDFVSLSCPRLAAAATLFNCAPLMIVMSAPLSTTPVVGTPCRNVLTCCDRLPLRLIWTSNFSAPGKGYAMTQQHQLLHMCGRSDCVLVAHLISRSAHPHWLTLPPLHLIPKVLRQYSLGQGARVCWIWNISSPGWVCWDQTQK